MAVRRVRLEAHFAPEVHALLKRAAEIEGRSLTDFVVAAGSTAARRTIEHAQIIRLGAESSELVAALLSGHSDTNPAMKKAKRKHRLIFGPL